MKTALIARKALIAALLVPMFATAGVVVTPDVSMAQQAGPAGGAPGGNNSGGDRGDRGGDNPDSGDGTSALDIACLAAPCKRPPRRPPPPEPKPVISVSTAPDCSCKLRTVKSGGQFVQVKDCYQIVRNTLRYCEPVAQ